MYGLDASFRNTFLKEYGTSAKHGVFAAKQLQQFGTDVEGIPNFGIRS